MINKAFVHSVALIFWSYGTAFVFYPDYMHRWVTESTVAQGSILIDIRATYGGMSIAIGSMLHYLATGERRVILGLYFVLLLMLTMAMGRMIGIVVDGGANFVMYLYLVLELVASITAITLLKMNKGRETI